MNIYLDLFNNRERAIIVWVLLFLGYVLFNKDIRKSFFSLFKALLHWKILIVIIAMFLYIGGEVMLFYKIDLWNVLLVKDTILWILGVAFIFLVNANNALHDDNHFKKILQDSIKIILLLEFIVNYFTFSFWIEIILMPFLFIVGAMGVLAEMKKEHARVKMLIDFVILAYVITLIVFAFINIINEYNEFATIDNLRSFVLPLFLTVIYIPFIYFFALCMAYETLFVRLSILTKNDDSIINFAKRKIFALCHINLSRLNKFAKESTRDLLNLNNKSDVTNMIQNYKNKL